MLSLSLALYASIVQFNTAGVSSEILWAKGSTKTIASFHDICVSLDCLINRYGKLLMCLDLLNEPFACSETLFEMFISDYYLLIFLHCSQ